jgi:hypothetical protein
VHWDLTPEQQQQLNGLFQHHRIFVRLRPEGQAIKPLQEVRVQPEARHWFIQADEAGGHYIAEVGYYGAAHDWKLVQASQPVRLPPEAVSTERRSQFATFDPDVPLLGARRQDQPTGSGKEAESQPQKPPVQLTFPLVPRWENAPRTAETKLALPPLKAGELVTPNLAPTDVVVDDLAAEWTPSQEQALEELIAWTSSRREPSGSAEIEHLLKGVAPASLEGASLELLIPPQVTSSPTGGQPAGPVGFWLNVNAELIIYGATEPNARLTLGGHQIQLRPDGTFSCRFALPDGQFELPISAESVLGEKRQVSLAFGRSTTYKGEVGVQAPDPALNRPGDKTAV